MEPVPPQTKLAALAVYAETGNQSEAARVAGVSQTTIGEWAGTPEGASLIDELRSTIRYDCGWQLARMVKRTLNELEESLDKGDPKIITRSGKNAGQEIVYVRPSAKDTVVTLSVLIDKWFLISGNLAQSNAITERMDTMANELSKLGAMLTGAMPVPRGTLDPSLPPPLSPTGPDVGPPGDNPGVGENFIG